MILMWTNNKSNTEQQNKMYVISMNTGHQSPPACTVTNESAARQTFLSVSVMSHIQVADFCQ